MPERLLIENIFQERLLKGHRPYAESDHVLTHVYNLFVGGGCIEDISNLQCSEPVRLMLGASRIPDPTTAGDFLRRFDGDSLGALNTSIDQENIIEQLQNGIPAMRMPTGSFLANSAYLICARLAHNLKSWLAQLALPQEVMRWEWKRFRHAFVYIALRVVRHARQITLYIADSQRYAGALRAAIVRLNQ